MNLIKPPCCNTGQITEEQRCADEFLTAIAKGEIRFTGKPFEVLVQQYECEASKLSQCYDKPLLRDNRHSKTYTVDEIYYMCKRINNHKSVPMTEWNSFLYEFIQLAQNKPHEFDKLLSNSVEQGIKEFVCWDRQRIKAQMDIVVSVYADTNKSTYNDKKLNFKAQNEILAEINNNPFCDKEHLVKEVCMRYNFYTPWGEEQNRYTMGVMK